MSNDTIKCPICNGTDFKVIANLGKARLRRCKNCKLVVNSVNSGCVSKEYYQDEYNKLYGSYYKGFRNKQFKKVLERTEEVEFTGKRVLDIGCSYGWFLKKAKEFGWNAVGIEPSEKVFGVLSKEQDIEVYNYDISEVDKVPGSFDLITMWNVFEHLKEPNNVLKALCRKLNKNGVLLLCVPNFEGLITKLSFLVHWLTLGRTKEHLWRLYQMDNVFPHLFHYSKKNLETLLQNNKLFPFLFWEQKIVDLDNLGERIKAYTGNNRVVKGVFVFLLRSLYRFSKLLKREDEIVVMARKL